MVMKMYALPPVQPLRGNVALPESMYQLPPIMRLSHLNNDDRPLSTGWNWDDVEARQSSLLSQLQLLQTKVASLRKDFGLQEVEVFQKLADSSFMTLYRDIPRLLPLGATSWSWTISHQSNVTARLGKMRGLVNEWRQLWSDVSAEVHMKQEPMKRVSVVVHADPRYPPYSLLCVGNLLKKAGFATKVNNHVHSALKEPVNKNLANHFDSSEWDECGDGSESCENYCLTVIWKLVGLDPYASIGFDIVKGEANILRHLVRSLSTVFHYETDDHQTLVFDSLMDDVHENVTWGSDRDCVSFLERSESFFLSGAQRSFVDFLVWSALLNKRFTIPSRRLLQWYTAGLRENGIPLQRRNSSRLSESRGGSMPRNRKKTLSCSSNHASAVIRVD
ncbi:uncharacterized protein LOC131879721 isoform X3 [Tigriopus californicus]|nr:uncharacterized protein LOC131879721 isoform X3 [Tigriopus californicus]